MARFMLHHRHEPRECGVASAAWTGHASPLRRHEALSSCRSGAHAVWWIVDAASAEDALALLPYFLAMRASATEVIPVMIP